MNTMMLALLQGRLWDTAATLQHRLRARQGEDDDVLDGELRQVMRALQALEQGRYGRCSGCDEPLEPDDLLMRPQRLLCAHCGRQPH